MSSFRHSLAVSADTFAVVFQDESRDIASEYAGGLKRYAPFNIPTPPRTRNSPPTPRNNPPMPVSLGTVQHPTLPPILPLLPEAATNPPYEEVRNPRPADGYPAFGHGLNPPPPPPPSKPAVRDDAVGPALKEVKQFLDDPEETLFMQVFVEEVGIWMDSLDPLKHVSSISMSDVRDSDGLLVFAVASVQVLE
jgi:hypothetical protein